MSITRIDIDTADSQADVAQRLDWRSDDPAYSLARLATYINGMVSARDANVRLLTGAVKATATLTFTGAPTADETFTINGVTFTAKASGATGNQFNIGGSVSVTAANVVTAVNASASAGVSGVVTASSLAGVVTFTANAPGKIGNGLTLAESMSNATVSGANFTGGTHSTDVTVAKGR